MLLKGKKILILGVANHRSIAFAIAKFCDDQGADICLTYQNERLKQNLEKLSSKFKKAPLCLPCDVGVDEQIGELFRSLNEHWGHLDGLVHSIAFANQDDLKGRFSETSKQGFLLAQDISSYSLTQLANAAKPLMVGGGSIICMSYLGGQRIVTNYNVMGVAKASLEMSAKYLAADLGGDGIRVNIVSPGPIRTLAAAGVSGFKAILDLVKERAPLKRNINQEEVAQVSAFLLSDLSTGVTGETIHVDAGYHIMGI